MTRKSVVSPRNWNIEKNTTLINKRLKRGTNQKNWYKNDTDIPLYLGLSIGIHLLNINSKNRKTLCEICPKLVRKAADQLCESKFLLISSFSIILTSLQSLNLSFPLLFCVISTAILKFPPWFPAFLPWFQISPRWFPAPLSPSHLSHSHSIFSAFPSFHFPFSHLGFHR